MAFVLAACGEGEEPTNEPEEEETAAAAEAPAEEPSAGPELAPGEQLVEGTLVGTVRETMDSGGYTYMRVEEGARTNWVAAMQMEVEVGDRVEVSGGSAVHGFHSRTLDREFETLIFASRARVLGEGAATGGGAPAGQALPPGHPPMPSGHPPTGG